MIPALSAESLAREMLLQHADWTLRQLARFSPPPGTWPPEAARPTEATSPHLLLHGREILLRHRVLRDGSSPRVLVGPEAIEVFASEAANWRVVLNLWLRRLARKELIERLRLRALTMNLRPSRVGIRDQRSRWGSCSRKGSISLNWRLVMAPPEVLDYVVIHELSHMVEASHSRAFWRVVERWCPDWRQHRCWLRENGSRMLGS